MSLSGQTAQKFLDDVRPILERHDPDALVAHLHTHWPHPQLLEILESSHADARKSALVCLALTGSMADVPRIAAVLRDEDPATSAYAEYALWSIWFCAGGPEDNAALNQAVHLIGENRLAEAIASLSRLIERDPEFAELYNQRAIACFLANRYEDAITDSHRALALNPEHFGAQAGLGHCLAALERYNEALDAYQAALHLHPRLEGIRQSVECLSRYMNRPTMKPPATPSVAHALTPQPQARAGRLS